MNQSESIVDLLNALCAARLEFPAIIRNREGFSKRGGQKYQYADLNAIIDATAPALASHGLTLMQFLEDGPEETQVVVKSMLSHLSGQWITSSLTVKREEDPQNFGIITTYAKRYVQQAMLNISTEDDNDGVVTETKEPARERKPARQVPPEAKAEEPGRPTTAPSLTMDEINSLVELSKGCGIDVQGFRQDIRRLMALSAQTKITREFLQAHMTRAQYQQQWDAYTEKLKQSVEQSLDEDDVPLSEPPQEASGDTQASEGSMVSTEPADVTTEAGSPAVVDAGKVYATDEQLDDLLALAERVGPEATADTQQTIAHHKRRMEMGVYTSIESYLQKRLTLVNA